MLGPTLYDTCEPATEDNLVDFERELGARVPAPYREFLLQFNGACPEPNLFNFKDSDKGSDCRYILGLNGTDHDLRHYLETHKLRLPQGLLPIAYDSVGNLICISIRQQDHGHVYFWDHSLANSASASDNQDLADKILPVADSFDQFLFNLKDPAPEPVFKEGPDETEVERIMRTRDIKALKDLLMSGYDLDHMDDNYLTILDNATFIGDLQMVKLIVSRGAKTADALEIARDAVQFNHPDADHKGIVAFLEKIPPDKETPGGGLIPR